MSNFMQCIIVYVLTNNLFVLFVLSLQGCGDVERGRGKMSQYGRRAHTNMDILYLLLPIIGAFLLLFLVCCFGRKVKEMLHIPKELVLGRNFPGLASSSSTSSSRSSFSDSDSEGGVEDEPAMVINMNLERQRVLSQHRRRYTQVPSSEMVFTLQGDVDLHQQQGQQQQCQSEQQQLLAERHMFFSHHPHYQRVSTQLPFYLHALGRRPIGHRKSQYHRRSDSCPLLSDFDKVGGIMLLPEVRSSYVNAAHVPFRMHPNDFRFQMQCQANSDVDSDCDIPKKVVEKPDRQRHRSNSESDLPKRCLDYETDDYLAQQRLSQFSHRLSSTEFQLHAPEDCAVDIHSQHDLCATNQAEVG